MKKTLIALFLILFYSCNAQNKTYTQKLENDLKGLVKEVISYTCKVENGKIPTDTTKWIIKTTKTFDSLGNVFEINRQWNLGVSDRIIEFKKMFSGKGKDVAFKEISNVEEGKITEFNFKYIWSNDYNYTIICQEDSVYTTSITLDKEYSLVKEVFKDGDKIQNIQESESIYKNNKKQGIKIKLTQYEEDKVIVSYELQMIQNFDTIGNPTIIYHYNDISMQEVEYVDYKEYKYY